MLFEIFLLESWCLLKQYALFCQNVRCVMVENLVVFPVPLREISRNFPKTSRRDTKCQLRSITSWVTYKILDAYSDLKKSTKTRGKIGFTEWNCSESFRKFIDRSRIDTCSDWKNSSKTQGKFGLTSWDFSESFRKVTTSLLTYLLTDLLT